MSQMSAVKAQRARENRVYVRMLLSERQPAFAAALAFAEQYVVFCLLLRSFEAGYFPVQKRRRQYQPTPGPPMRANTRRLWAYCCRQAGSLGGSLGV